VTISVVITDDHPVVLMGLESLFSTDSGCRVVARCVNGLEALEAVEKHDPDLLLLDINMPKMGGLEVLRQLQPQRSRTRVVVLSASLRSEEVRTAVRLGARGVILKEEAPQQLLECVRAVAAGGYWFLDPELAALLDVRRSDKTTPELTDREREIAALIADGLRNKDIARQLKISEGTVKAHLHNIYKKLGVDTRLGLALQTRGR
jgi:DNA-binding NarL/FixJ family response regulator